MTDSLKVCIIGKPNFHAAYTIAHLINDGLVVITESTPKDGHSLIWKNECDSLLNEASSIINKELTEIISNSDKLQGCDHNSCWLDEFPDDRNLPYVAVDSICNLLEAKTLKFELPDPIGAEDLIFAKERKEHLKKCQPWKRKKKGRS